MTQAHLVKNIRQRILASFLARKMQRFFVRFPPPRSFDGYNKVFCVGWLKTGTTSFGNAMRRLGYKHCGWNSDVYEWYKSGNIDKIIKYAAYFESFDDLPWNRVEILPRLDREFPDSRFVLLVRDSESWFRSAQKHRVKYRRPGAGEENKEAFIREYEERNEFIKDYFEGAKKDQLLVMNVIEGEGYEKLCPFLGLPYLPDSFPHSNRSGRH